MVRCVWDSFISLWRWFEAGHFVAVWGAVEDLLRSMVASPGLCSYILGHPDRATSWRAVIANTVERTIVEYGKDSIPVRTFIKLQAAVLSLSSTALVGT
eukprot:COSAG01_NODE_1530_length_9964_cov_5.649879_4_plen_99_part_00